MRQIHTKDWFFTPQGDHRGFITPFTLRELWFHTGTICNLQCPFCLEGSRPGDQRLQMVDYDDLKPFIDEALLLGVEQFSFTGGEPFLAKDLIKILAFAAQYRPCLVLTNGTEPLQKRLDEVAELRNLPNPVSFRVSIDKPTAKEHDAGRGAGTFDKAMYGLKKLYDMGFPVSVARHMAKNEDRAAIDEIYAALFKENGLPEDLNIVVFPDFARPGTNPEVPQVTTSCMMTYQNEESRKEFMCAFSKMVVKKNGKMQVYACTLVDDDDEYSLGGRLNESLSEQISMKHHRCYNCFAYGSSCSEAS